MEDYKTYANSLEILNALFKTPWRSIRFLKGSWILIFNFWCVVLKKKKNSRKRNRYQHDLANFAFFISFLMKKRSEFITENLATYSVENPNKLSYANSRITHFLNLGLSNIFQNDFNLTRIIQSYIRVIPYTYVLFN